MIRKPCFSRFSLHKFVHLKFFWTQFKNVHLRGPCISRPYCNQICIANLRGHSLFLWTAAKHISYLTLVTWKLPGNSFHHSQSKRQCNKIPFFCETPCKVHMDAFLFFICYNFLLGAQKLTLDLQLWMHF